MSDVAPSVPTPEDHAEGPEEEISRSRIRLVMGALMLTMLLAALDQTIVSTALPTIVGELGGLNHLSWVVTAYLLASTASTPLYGKLGDMLGRKPVFLFAVLVFLTGSVLAVASVAGPLLGGFFVEALSWRWVFYVNLPIGVVAVLIIVFKLHLHTPAQRHAIDYLGATLLTAGVSAIILLTTWGGNEYPWGSATIVGLGVLGLVLI